ncbi:hypothetical protein [Haladaptatus sp. DFWS20]|uniref:hypothetical protein n=1 Tax=Haladaptatus sp. DFWS20 TaxID=3403467 RepID=UPI003EB7A684
MPTPNDRHRKRPSAPTAGTTLRMRSFGVESCSHDEVIEKCGVSPIGEEAWETKAYSQTTHSDRETENF